MVFFFFFFSLGRRGRFGLIAGALAGVGLEWFWTGRTIKKANKKHADQSTVSVGI